MSSSAASEHVRRSGPSRRCRSGEADGTTSTLNRSSTWSASPNVNCELPPPVSKTTWDPFRRVRAVGRGQVGEPALVLARDDLDLDAAPRLHPRRRAPGRSVRSGTMPFPTAAMAATPLRLRLLDHPGDGRGGPGNRLGLQPAGLVEPVAEARDLGAVDHRPPGAVRAALPDWNFTELVPTSMTAQRSTPNLAQHPEAHGRSSTLRPRQQPDRTDGCHDLLRVLRLHGHGAGGPVRGRDPGQLGCAPVEGEAAALLVHLDRHQPGMWLDHLRQHLCPRVRRALQRGDGLDAQRHEHGVDIGRCQRERKPSSPETTARARRRPPRGDA